MLCYRCGSYNADGSRKCTVCAAALVAPRRTTKGTPAQGRRATRGRAPLQPGTLWAGRYRIIEGVAAGIAGWVLRARDEEVDVDVALKLVSSNLLQTDAERASFLKILRNARKVHHPNVVRIYDDGQEKSQLYYTMPFLEGLTLRKIIDLRLEKEQVFSYAETLPLVAQLSAAADGWQKFGYHGALRPTNIIVLPDVLKVTGLAHTQGMPLRPFVALQTQAKTSDYLAPEVRREESGCDRRADLYSIAVIFAEMLTGQVLGRDPAAGSVGLAKLPRRLQAALRKALSEAPADRFESGAALFEELSQAVAEVAPDAAARAPGSASLTADFFEDSEPSSQVVPPAAPAVPSADVASPRSPEAVRRTTPVTEPPQIRPPRPGLTPGVERRGSVKRRGNGVLVVAGTVLLAALAISAARWYRYMATQPTVQGSVASPVETAAPIEPLPAEPGAPAPESGGASPAPSPSPAIDGAGQTMAVATAAVTKDGGAGEGATMDTGKAAGEGTGAGAGDGKPAGEGTGAGTREGSEKDDPPPPPPPPPPPRSGNGAGAGSATVAQRGCPPGMVAIKQGRFAFGSEAGDPMRGFGDLPLKQVDSDAYCIDIYEFPNQRGKQPTTNVPWARAKKACEAVGKRLCSEEEWERACKGPAGFRFPFGNKFNEQVCNISENGKVAAAGEFSRCRSGYGVADMAGNAAEWTASRWSGDVPDKVVKGGAADQASYTARCSARANEGAVTRNANIGFRCCADPK